MINKMKLSTTILICIISIIFSVSTCAEEVAKEFYYEYEAGYELVLLYDQCDKTNVSKGWQAEVRQVGTSNIAKGCWIKVTRVIEGNPVDIIFAQVKPSDSLSTFDFSYLAKRFEPRFGI